MITSLKMLQIARPVPGRYASIFAPRKHATLVCRVASQLQGRRYMSLVPANEQRRCESSRLHTSRHTKLQRNYSTESSSSTLDSDVKAAPPQEPQPTSKPPYKPPTTGLVARLPAALIPYAELSRLSAPAGTYYLLAPCLFSTLLAASILAPPAAPATVLHTMGLYALGATTMRGAGCTINDLWDRHLDRRVARTRLRPLARGAVSVPAAMAWAGTQCLVGLAVLVQFPPYAIAAAVPSLVLVACYPLAKRVTSYPQFVLGLTFSWGALLGLPALGVDLFPAVSAALAPFTAMLDFGLAGPLDAAAAAATTAVSLPDGALPATALLYTSCVVWTLLYDTIYAFQDIADDAKAGIKSSARAQERHPKRFLALLGATQVALLGGVGLAAGLGPAYFIGTCGGAAVTLGTMVWRVRLGDVADCAAWFRRGAWFAGGGIGLGFFAEWLVRRMDDEEVPVNTGDKESLQG